MFNTDENSVIEVNTGRQTSNAVAMSPGATRSGRVYAGNKQVHAIGGGPSATASVIFTNIRSVFPKRDSLSSLINDTGADIVVLTETWLSDKIQTGELFQCNKKFTVYRLDRADRRGGGVLIAINSCFESFRLSVTTNLELLWCCLSIGFKKNNHRACYRPPNPDYDFAE